MLCVLTALMFCLTQASIAEAGKKSSRGGSKSSRSYSRSSGGKSKSYSRSPSRSYSRSRAPTRSYSRSRAPSIKSSRSVRPSISSSRARSSIAKPKSYSGSFKRSPSRSSTPRVFRSTPRASGSSYRGKSKPATPRYSSSRRAPTFSAPRSSKSGSRSYVSAPRSSGTKSKVYTIAPRSSGSSRRPSPSSSFGSKKTTSGSAFSRSNGVRSSSRYSPSFRSGSLSSSGSSSKPRIVYSSPSTSSKKSSRVYPSRSFGTRSGSSNLTSKKPGSSSAWTGPLTQRDRSGGRKISSAFGGSKNTVTGSRYGSLGGRSTITKKPSSYSSGPLSAYDRRGGSKLSSVYGQGKKNTVTGSRYGSLGGKPRVSPIVTHPRGSHRGSTSGKYGATTAFITPSKKSSLGGRGYASSRKTPSHLSGSRYGGGYHGRHYSDSRKQYGGYSFSPHRSGRGGLHVRIGASRHGCQRYGHHYGRHYGSYHGRYRPPWKKCYSYYGCADRYVARCYPRFSIGFGFHHYSSYPSYPVYSTVYEPYPVYETVYEPYPVYTTPSYFIADSEPLVVESYGSGTYVEEPVVGYTEVPADTGVEAYGYEDTEGAILEQPPSDEPVVVTQPQVEFGPGEDVTDDAAVIIDETLESESRISGQPSQPEVLEPYDGAAETPVGSAVTAPDSDGARPAMPVEQMNELMKQGVEEFSEGEYEQAAQRFLRVAMADPDNVDAALAYATARFATGDYPVSAIAIRRGIRRLPDVVNSLFDIRDRYNQLAHFDRHYEVLVEYVSENPENIDGQIVLGFVQHFTGQREPAAETFKRVAELSEADRDLAEIFINAKPLEELLPPETQPAGSASGTAPATRPAE